MFTSWFIGLLVGLMVYKLVYRFTSWFIGFIGADYVGDWGLESPLGNAAEG